MIKKLLQYGFGGVLILMIFFISGRYVSAAVPQVVGLGLISSDQMIINFSEPMNTSSVVFSTNPLFDFTPVWSNNNTTVALKHLIFSANQSYTVTISAGTDLATGSNSISNLPYVVNVVSGIVQPTVLVPSNISVLINGGASTTNSGNVTLTVAATNAISMRFSNNPFFTDANWENYATSKNWTLGSGNGIKTVYAKFISSTGIESDIIHVNINVDSSYVPVSVTPEIPAVPVTPTTPEVTPVTPATPTTQTEGCSTGNLFSATSGLPCIVGATPAVPATSVTPVTSVPKTYNFGTVTLRNGSRGEAVKELQRFLNQILNLGLVVDGILGPRTIIVVKQWQKDNGLVADGLIGAKTKAKMNASIQ